MASKQPLDLPSLSPRLLDVQQRLDQAAYIGVLESMLAEQRIALEEREQLIQRLHVAAGDLRNQVEAKEQFIRRYRLEAGDRRPR